MKMSLVTEISIDPQVLKKYRALLLDIENKFAEYDLEKLKFVLNDDIPIQLLEACKNPRDVFLLMEKYGHLGPKNFDILCQCLTAIRRPDLIEKLHQYEDAGSSFPLKARADNYLEKDGYSVSIKEGRHFDTTGGEFVEVRSGSNYTVTVRNKNKNRCIVNLAIDGYEMFPNGFPLGGEKFVFGQPLKESKNFKFFALVDAPEGSGINKWRTEQNGLIQVKFTPERADMKITCTDHAQQSHVIYCSENITDAEFIEMVRKAYGGAEVVPFMINSSQPLTSKGEKLTEYGIGDQSTINVVIRGVRGHSGPSLVPSSTTGNTKSKKNVHWRAGATTLEPRSNQEFRVSEAQPFPSDPTQAVTLNLRLVTRKNERPLPATSDPTPLTRATLIPPPVPN